MRTLILFLIVFLPTFLLAFNDVAEHSKKLCTKNWTKAGVLDQRMFNYCMKTHASDAVELKALHSKHNSEKWFSKVSLDCEKKWTEAGNKNYSMIESCFKGELDGIAELKFQLKNKNNLTLIQKCFARWKNGKTAFSMTAYCVKKNVDGNNNAYMYSGYKASGGIAIEGLLGAQSTSPQKNQPAKNTADVPKPNIKLSNIVLASARLNLPPAKALPANGNFNSENVPLGQTLATIKKQVSQCKVEKASGAPLVMSLTGYDPPIEQFFPLKDKTYIGYGIYFGWVGGLRSNKVDVYDMKCPAKKRYTLVFDKTYKRLLVYQKSLTVKSTTVEKAMQTMSENLKSKCSSGLQGHSAVSNDKSVGRFAVPVLYCQSHEKIIVTSSNSQYAYGQNVPIDIAFVSGRGWYNYISELTKIRDEQNNKVDRQISNEL